VFLGLTPPGYGLSPLCGSRVERSVLLSSWG
jgi:hypothetical protein